MTNKQRFAAFLAGGIILGITGGYVAGRLIMSDGWPSDGSQTPSPTNATNVPNPIPSTPAVVAEPGSTFVTTVNVDGVGEILVQVSLPASARYDEGAPVVVSVPTFFTPEISGFHPFPELVKNGIISVTLMYPGREDGNGRYSAGTDDFGGANSLKALRDTILFALGKKSDSNGYRLDQLSAISPLYTDVGIYAFSHPGIAATNVLASYASDLKDVKFLVAYENPTQSLFCPLELGHYAVDGKQKVAVNNPAYQYPEDYSPTNIVLDYSTVRFDAETSLPYFDLNGNKSPDATGDFLFGDQIPTMFGKRTYSAELLTALRDSGSLSAKSWPADLATPEEAEEIWSIRQTVESYPKLAALRNLHVILVFAKDGHVQSISDNPNIHQSYDGLRAAGIWTRLNPDAAYVSGLSQSIGALFQEHAANTQPQNWLDSDSWSFPGTVGSTALVPLAATLELADRARANDWSANLSGVLETLPIASQPKETPAIAVPPTTKPPKDDIRSNCGDGTCVSPENPDRCPADCPTR